MKKRVLFVLGGFVMGGVETYVTRLAKELFRKNCEIDILLLSDNFNDQLIAEISTYSKVIVFEKFSYLNASSWLNAYMPYKILEKEYDIVHVVDMLTLGFISLNQHTIKFKALSIGIYHSLELVWWEDKNIYFRRKLLELYKKNVLLTLFPNENTAQMASKLTGTSMCNLSVLPLGVDLLNYSRCKPSFTSKRIISIGRLVDFKIYNQHLILQIKNIRKFGNFEYYIYGEGSEKAKLQQLAANHGVQEYVHFMGQVDYKNLPSILNEAFCFIGSGTVLIEASAAGIPSIVGIESIQTPTTCGFFSEVVGYSYNEISATTKRIQIIDAFKGLVELSEGQYLNLSNQHRKKASEFDLCQTSTNFLNLSTKKPDFRVSINSFFSIASFCYAVLRFGPKALKGRFNL